MLSCKEPAHQYIGVGQGYLLKGLHFSLTGALKPLQLLKKMYFGIKCFIASLYNLEKAFSPEKNVMAHINSGSELARSKFYVPSEMLSSFEKYFIMVANQGEWAAKCSQSR